MTEDFYDRMKKEQELLNLSYQESLRQKNARMAVWDPNDKTTVLSQIKKPIQARYRGLKGWVVCLYPGILLILVFFAFGLLPGCSWPWQKENVREVDSLSVPPREFICKKIDCGDEDIDKLVAEEQNTIACIKLQPECNSDLEN